MALLLPSRWVVQPPQPVEIDPRHGLVPAGLYLGTAGATNLANGQRMVAGGAVVTRASAAGLGLLQNAINTGLSQALPALRSAPEYTAIWHGVSIGTPVGGTPAFLGVPISSGAQSQSVIGIEYVSASQLSVLFQSGGIVSARSGSFNWADVTGHKVTLVASYSTLDGLVRLDLHFNGHSLRVIEASVSGAASPTLSGTEQFTVGPDTVEQPSRHVNANVALAGVFYGRLRDAVVPEILANPWQLFRPLQRRIWVPGSGASAQELTPSLLVNTQSFFAPAVAPGAVQLSPGLLTNASALFAPTVTRGAVTLTPDLLSNAQEFFPPTVQAGTATLAPQLLANGQTFYGPTVTRGAVLLQPGLLANVNTFYPPTVSAGGSVLQPSLLVNAQEFYAPTVTRGAVTVSPPLLSSTNQFFSPTVTVGTVLRPPLLANSQTFFAPAVTAGEVELLPPLIASAAIFFAPTVTTGVVVRPPLLQNTSTVYPPQVSPGRANLTPSLLVNQSAVFAPAVVADQILAPALLVNDSLLFPPTVVDRSIDIEIDPRFIARPEPRNWVAKNSPRNWEAR